MAVSFLYCLTSLHIFNRSTSCSTVHIQKQLYAAVVPQAYWMQYCMWLLLQLTLHSLQTHWCVP